MRFATIILSLLSAGPALAHHEVVVVASLVPMYISLIAIPLAGFTAWWRNRR